MRALQAFRPGRPWSFVVAGIAIVLVPALLAQSAEASTPRDIARTAAVSSSWRIQNTPNPQVRDESFSAISCTSSSNCVAVGDRLNLDNDQVTLAEIWNGTKWKMMRTPNPVGSEQPELTSVSCASAEECVAVGTNYGEHGFPLPMAESWNGSEWTLDTLPGGSAPGFMNAVSCPSANQCLAVGERFNRSGGLGESAADSWNGSTWEQTLVVQPPENNGASLSSVSCSSEDSCEAVGSFAGDSEEGVTLAEMWNGTDWAIQKTPNPKGSSYSVLSSVSCVSASECVAVGLGSPVTQAGPNTLGEIWNGTDWSIMSTPNPSGSDGTQLNGVSCSSSTSCAAAGENVVGSEAVNDTLAMTWNGRKWTIEPSETPSAAGGYLVGVACSSASTCTAVGLSFGAKSPSVLLVETWNGTTWSVQRARGAPGLVGAGLSGVSCVSDSFCLAVGNDDDFFDPIAEIWNGTDWKVTPAPVGEEGGTLDDVSCISTTDCIAVGSPSGEEKGLAEEWNGTSWTALSTPAGQGVLEHISCTSATACMAVGITLSNTESSKPLAESWNGTQWTVTQMPKVSGSSLLEMQGVSCTSAESCVAVGAALNMPQLVAAPLIFSWDGTKWTSEKSAISSIGNLSLTGVSCASSTDCVAVGYTIDKLQSPGAFSEIWNGSTWASVKIPTPTGGAELSGIQCSSATACTTVGTRSRGALAEGFNGTAWTVQKTAIPQGAGTSAAFEGLSCTSSTSCTAVGSFSNASGLQLTLAEAT
jgi:hypothetical protein